MKYHSTRGQNTDQSFCDILLAGLADDGGLYLPTNLPQINTTELERLRQVWQKQGYAALAFEILQTFMNDIPRDDLQTICYKTYTKDVFGTSEITPLRSLEQGIWIQGLSNGPTLAFKDMAMQLLGQLFEYQLAKTNRKLNILGATSGDTGSAAEYAMRGKKGVNVFMLSPHGRMSPFQQAQMFSLLDSNIHNIAVEGVFDDCQDMVKAVSHDAEFKQRYHIGTVNSINWARLLAQIIYYFAGYFASGADKVSFSVPSGNFGNVCAGHLARRMGLPIGRLMVATNENDVLDEFFKTGVYRPRPSAQTYETSSPSMDISKASNFERWVFDFLGEDSQKTKALFEKELNEKGFFDLNLGLDLGSGHTSFANAVNELGFVSGRSTHADRLATIAKAYHEYNELIDPHTADALGIAKQLRYPNEVVIVLETALPIKFAQTIQEAIGHPPPYPSAFQGIEALPKRVQVLPVGVDGIKQYIKLNS